MITQELAAYGYLIAAICFIMALRGLSSPVTSRQGNLYGVIGMVVAVNNQIQSADIYASSDLFRELWPKLMRANAVAALAELTT